MDNILNIIDIKYSDSYSKGCLGIDDITSLAPKCQNLIQSALKEVTTVNHNFQRDYITDSLMSCPMK